MEIDPSDAENEALRKKSETLKTLSTGPISSSVSKLSASSRVFPSEKDFHFYYNFPEFKSPVDEIGAKSHSMLRQIGATQRLWGGKDMPFPEEVEDDSCDWLVNVNDEVMERFDVSCDEFSRLRKAEEDAARARPAMDENGFQLVCGRKKKVFIGGGVKDKEDSAASVISPTVRVAERDKKTAGPKPKVPFHIPTIRRPQEEYNILVNNSNQPFQHVWLERSEDGARFVHPLENLSVIDFVDKNVESLEPMVPPPLESTPFTMVVDVKDLKEMAAKLRAVNEFAVDLEHNQYRSFQGLTCLMQVSTRTEDFVVDTLKLRIHIGPHLREVFKDPMKKKVMHGADRDIAWLQRDFGIYVCNLFDTGQASRVLQMERNSLEHLLQHFCGVAANKEYQNADWRLRPLPNEMIRYAREDTHYLLYIYDLMRIRLLSESTDPEDFLLLEVYKRSYDICMQLYEKELLTDTSYLYIYGVQGANLNAQQLSVVAGLCEWRDAIARQEDESTGYILPNKLLLEIAKQMPLTTGNLRRLLKSKHPYVDRSLNSVVNIIRHSVQNATAFEQIAEQLKEGRIQVPELNSAEDDFPELQTAGDSSEGYSGGQNEHVLSPLQSKGAAFIAGHEFNLNKDRKGDLFVANGQNGNLGNDSTDTIDPKSQRDDLAFPGQRSDLTAIAVHSGKVAEATVQVLKKPGRGFGALLGSSASKKKTNLNQGVDKLEQIKSSVNLPFYSFLRKDQEPEQASKTFEEPTRTSEEAHIGDHLETTSSSNSEDIILLDGDQQSNNMPEEPKSTSKAPHSAVHPLQSDLSPKVDDIILLDSDSNDDEPSETPDGDEDHANKKTDKFASEPELVVLDDEDDDEEPPSLSDLSSSFEKCLQPVSQDHISKQEDKLKETDGLQFKPFDYEAARKQLQFGERADTISDSVDYDKNSGKKKCVASSRSKQDEALLPQGKRRQAFPASGNRSVTFR